MEALVEALERGELSSGFLDLPVYDRFAVFALPNLVGPFELLGFVRPEGVPPAEKVRRQIETR